MRQRGLRQAPIAKTVFEPRVGGRIYDHGTDGSECHWARVLTVRAVDPCPLQLGHRPQWQHGTDPEHTSEVEIRFAGETPEQISSS